MVGELQRIKVARMQKRRKYKNTIHMLYFRYQHTERGVDDGGRAAGY